MLLTHPFQCNVAGASRHQRLDREGNERKVTPLFANFGKHWGGGGGEEGREGGGREGGRKVGVGKQVACPKGGSGVWHVEEQTCLLVQ